MNRPKTADTKVAIQSRAKHSRTPAIMLAVIATFLASGRARGQGLGNVRAQPVPIQSIRVDSHPNETQIVIELSAAVHFTYERLSKPDRLDMDLWGTRLSPQMKYGRIPISNPFLTAINIDETPIGTRVLIDLSFDGSYDVFAELNPPRIVVKLKNDSKPEPVQNDLNHPELAEAERRARAEKSLQVIERLESSRIPRNPPAAAPEPAPRTDLPTVPTAALAVPAQPLRPTPAVSPEPPTVVAPLILVSATRTLTIPKVSRPPRLDDFMNGIPREAEVRVTEFRQREPADGQSISQGTAAYLSYDDKNLYVVFVCKDDPRKVRARMVQREAIFEDDMVSVYLDTFHDRQHAYVFSANPLGIQQDGTIAEGRRPDYTFDTLWHSKGRLTPEGFIVWIAVPFKSVRFSSAPGQTWGVALGRSIVHNNEKSFWPYITQRENSFVKQMASLEGLRNISTGHSVQVIPYGTFTRSEQTDEQHNMVKSDERRRGMDAKVVFDDRVSLDVTINPDFSEIESNEPQVTINQRFEVFFPEKRPFFIENPSLFQTPLNLFFSRRIADPEYGARLTGKIGRWGVAALAADDRAANSSSRATKLGAEIGAVRIVRDIGEQSSVGVLALGRDFGPSSSRVFSADARIKLAANWVLTGQIARSYDKSIDGTKRSGPSYFGELTHAGRHFIYSHSYSDVSPDFRAPLGFIPRVDIRQSGQYVSYSWRPEDSKIVSFGPAWTGVVNLDRSGRVQDWYSAADFKVFLKGQTQLTVQRSEAFELFAARGFRKQATNASFSTAWLKWIGMSAFYQQGATLNYSPGQGLAPFLSGAQIASFATTLQPAPRIRSEQMYIYSRLATLPNSGLKTTIFNNHIIRWKTNFQLSRALSFRTIIDYNALLPNTSLFAPPKYANLSGDALLTYLLNPGTALYVGYNTRYEQNVDPVTPAPTRTSPLLSTPVGRQLFVKVSYLFRF